MPIIGNPHLYWLSTVDHLLPGTKINEKEWTFQMQCCSRWMLLAWPIWRNYCKLVQNFLAGIKKKELWQEHYIIAQFMKRIAPRATSFATHTAVHVRTVFPSKILLYKTIYTWSVHFVRWGFHTQAFLQCNVILKGNPNWHAFSL